MNYNFETSSDHTVTRQKYQLLSASVDHEEGWMGDAVKEHGSVARIPGWNLLEGAEQSQVLALIPTDGRKEAAGEVRRPRLREE